MLVVGAGSVALTSTTLSVRLGTTSGSRGFSSFLVSAKSSWALGCELRNTSRLPVITKYGSLSLLEAIRWLLSSASVTTLLFEKYDNAESQISLSSFSLSKT